jgi:hypothetical protein
MISQIGLMLVLIMAISSVNMTYGTDNKTAVLCDNDDDSDNYMEETCVEFVDDDCPIIDGEWRSYDLLDRSWCDYGPD